MGIFDGCLLACDVDGTLIYGDYFPPRNKTALDYFVSEGGTLTLSTGRTAAALTPIIEMYNNYGPSVVANGSMIYDPVNDKIFYEKALTDSDKAITLDILNRFPDTACELHTGKHVTVISRTRQSDDHELYEKIPTDFKEKEEIFSLDIQKTLLLFDSEAKRSRAKEYLKTVNATCNFTDSACTIDGEKRYYLEQLPKGVSKAATLKLLCEMLEIRKDNIFAVGDYYNDIEMLEFANIAACPSSSPDEVKAIADFVVCDVKDGAVADFIDILKEKRLNGC